MFRLFVFLTASLLTSFSALVCASDAIVVHSTVDTLSSGQLLSKQAVINLTENSEITATFATGGVQTLKGPYHGRLIDPREGQQSDSTLIAGLAQLIQQLKAEQKTSVRGRQRNNEGLWTVDVNSPKKYYCIPTSQQLMLSRLEEESKLASTVVIKHKETEQQTQVMWPARKNTLAWPDALPLVYGDTYTVSVNSVRGQEHFKMVILYRLPDSLPTESHKVVWMAGRGCTDQAEMLLVSLR